MRLGRFVVALCAMLMVTGSARADQLSPRAFTDAFTTAISAAVPNIKFNIKDDLEVEAPLASGRTLTIDLHNAYGAYREDPNQLAHIIQSYVAGMAELTQKPDAKAAIDRSRIVPILKSPKWLAQVRQTSAGNAAPPEPLTEPYNGELTIAYAEDQKFSMRFLTTHDDVGDRAALHDLALANLRRLLPKMEMRGGADGIRLINAGGNYESSMLLLDDIWSSGQIEVDGSIVVAVPANNALFVTGSHNHIGISRMRDIARKIVDGPYGLTQSLFIYRAGKFVVFDGE